MSKNEGKWKNAGRGREARNKYTTSRKNKKKRIKCTKLSRLEAIMCFGCLFLGVFLKSA
jgi:hypothetical protein